MEWSLFIFHLHRNLTKPQMCQCSALDLSVIAAHMMAMAPCCTFQAAKKCFPISSGVRDLDQRGREVSFLHLASAMDEHPSL